ncbi:MAG: Y-family DNA polymerase [Metamycoplasmataceae bacterium]
MCSNDYKSIWKNLIKYYNNKMIKTQKKNKVILHIDVDSFFVSCEVALRPELANKEVAIGIDSPRSIVTSLSYAAKAKGAKVPWKLGLVKEYCRNLIVIEPNMTLYQNFSKKIYDFLVKNYHKDIEIVSVDEWYIDASDIWKKYGSIRNLAIDIQKKIMKKLSMPISIGISYNKYLAKMATAINKPMGITFITHKNYQDIIWPMPIDNYYGIGYSTAPQLKKIGIKTIGDLAKCNYNDPKIRKIFLNQSKTIIDNANGIGNSDLNLEKNILKSIGNERMFMSGFTDNTKEIYNGLRYIAQLVSQRLLDRNLCGRHITINIKLDNKRKSKSMQIDRLINTEADIYLYASRLLKILWNDEPLIGIGISISKIEDLYQNPMNQSLFEEQRALSPVESIIENVNSKMKKKVLISGKELKKHNSTQQNKYL